VAMLIAGQTINATRRSNSPHFTSGFLVVASGQTIKDRLRLLPPNDPDNYYVCRELIPINFLDDLRKVKVVIANFHAFNLRERVELSAGGRALLQCRGE
jgi:type III restriction enzyme